MKRISSWPRTGSAQASLRLWSLIVLLVCTPGIAHAWYYGSFEGVHYSPYALNYYHSGLVPPDIQYTPYIFNYYHSGLVQGYGFYPGYADAFAVPVPRFRHGFRSSAILRAPPAVRRHAQASPCPAPKRDPMNVIRQHLHAKGFTSACIDRILRVDNQLVSVDFLVKDRNVLIKYWNPQELERLGTKEGYKQKACAKYKEDWERYAQQYRQTGGEIYTISVSEPEAIVAALDSCTKLSPGLGAPAQQTMYAKK